MKPITKAIILCGGMATRMLPITKSIPKEMLPILDKPILQYLIDDLKQIGIKEIGLVLSPSKQPIIDYYTKNKLLEQELEKRNKHVDCKLVQSITDGIQIHYLIQKNANGTMDAILKTKHFVNNQPFFVFFGDEYVQNNNYNIAKQMLDCFIINQKSILAIQEVPDKDVDKYGIIKAKPISKDFMQVEYMVEKPKLEDSPSNLSYVGPAILTSEIFDSITKCMIDREKHPQKHEYYLTDAYQHMASNHKLYALKIYGTRFDIGNKLSFVQSNILASLSDERYSEEIKKFLIELVKMF